MLEHRLSALLPLHLHPRLNTWFQYIAERHLHADEKHKFWDLVQLILQILQYIFQCMCWDEFPWVAADSDRWQWHWDLEDSDCGWCRHHCSTSTRQWSLHAPGTCCFEWSHRYRSPATRCGCRSKPTMYCECIPRPWVLLLWFTPGNLWFTGIEPCTHATFGAGRLIWPSRNCQISS